MTMTSREINKLVLDYIGTNNGYLNGFSYGIHDRFYHRYCDVDVDVQSYRNRYGTTLNAFIGVLKEATARDQAKIIRGVFDMIRPPEETSTEGDRKKVAVHKELLDVASRLDADGLVDTPNIALTSEVVFEALKDAEVLLNSRGPKSAVDRAHTALHGYLRKACSDRGFTTADDASLTALFKIIREQFPEFATAIPHDAEAKRLVGSIASALDSLNTIRNRGTLAHPNEVLLEPSEAMLYINLSRAVLGYVETKTKK
jgi:hypothetical protein